MYGSIILFQEKEKGGNGVRDVIQHRIGRTFQFQDINGECG